MTVQQHATREIKTVEAVAIGGPAAGRRFPVPLTAGTWPRFLGLDGGSYVRDGCALADEPTYLYWPAGASAPVPVPGRD